MSKDEYAQKNPTFLFRGLLLEIQYLMIANHECTLKSPLKTSRLP